MGKFDRRAATFFRNTWTGHQAYLKLALSLKSLTKVGSPNSCICSTITAQVSFRMRVCVNEGKMPPEDAEDKLLTSGGQVQV